MAPALSPTASPLSPPSPPSPLSPLSPPSPPNGAFTASFCIRHSTVRSIFCSGPPSSRLENRLSGRCGVRAELKAASMDTYNVCPGCVLEASRVLKR
ncbi:hypothetical protein K488DRAFT_90602 [Vararia minispora EC-137]|uniref:Uncharacterized protein n=1 Tax=Vararia minispora EC-137 TaxID=1314806 RepID=A0ACB8Q751_9AGAM|nr:hypothetical protein K488DRAFT_90602 [Vararia minispora EC-137]